MLVRGTKREAERALARLVAEIDLKPALPPVDEPVTWGPPTTINDAIRAWRENGWQDLSARVAGGRAGPSQAYRPGADGADDLVVEPTLAAEVRPVGRR